MKKILLPFVFIFTSAVAQKTVYTDPIALAKKEVTELLKIIQLDENQIDTILNLLISKHEELEKNSINKNEIIKNILYKIETSLGSENFKKVKQNKLTYQDLLD